MRDRQGTTYCILALLIILSPHSRATGNAPTNLSLQEDGSLVVFDAKGGVAEFVKQGTPRQAIQLDGQSCNVSYGFNSAGKQTVLVSLPASATTPVVFLLGDSQVTIPPKSGLRIALTSLTRSRKWTALLQARFSFRTSPPARNPLPNFLLPLLQSPPKILKLTSLPLLKI